LELGLITGYDDYSRDMIRQGLQSGPQAGNESTGLPGAIVLNPGA
jgi:hypothetical protein